ncbi:hypothetical protein HMPREF9946_03161 [Acetobacteraceae bacterium AT-5844]|nr:hypothetical protein HMPREF9946_03161 [Acetobacteraceae bacterium AT-5844]
MSATVYRVGGDYSALNLGTILPVTDGLVGAYFPGYDAARTGKNHAPGGVDGVVVGTPTYFEGYARFTGQQHFVELDLPETDAITYLIVWRSVTSGTPSYRFPIGNLGASTAYPSAVYGAGIRGAPSASSLGMGVTGGAATSTPGVSYAAINGGLDNTQWAFAGGTTPADGAGREVFDLTRGIRQATAPALSGGRLINTEKKIRLGSSHWSGDNGAQVDVAAAFVFTRVTSQEEQQALYELCQFRLAGLSSPIVI